MDSKSTNQGLNSKGTSQGLDSKGTNQGLDSVDIAEAIELHPVVRAIIPVRFGVQYLGESTLKQWLYGYERQGIIALVDAYSNCGRASVIEENAGLKRYVLGFMLKFPHASASKLKAALSAQKPELDLVHEQNLARYMDKWKTDNAQLWTFVTHPDKWKNVYMPAYGSHSEGIEHLNQLWEMDSTPGDWLLTDGRHSVLGVIDLFSRRMVFYVSKSSSSKAVGQAFRKAVLAWGVPERIRTYNGKDYVSDYFSTALIELEIVQDLCIPFASEEKGTIERSLGTMSHGILELLPGFAGHNVAEAQQIRGMKSFAQRIMTPGEVIEVAMTAHELQTTLDQWANVVYGQDKHSGLNGRSPNQMAALYGRSVRRISNERALDMLLAETAATRCIGKKGIRFNGRDYIAYELAQYAGKDAVLKYDEADIGRLYVYVEGEFICVAECPDITGISRREVAVVTKKHIKKQLTAQARELKAFKKDIAADLPALVIQHRVETAGNVEWFPRPAVEHSTPALVQAGLAAVESKPWLVPDKPGFELQGSESKPSLAPDKPRFELQAETAKVIAFLTTEPEVNPIHMNDAQRWDYWNRLHDRQCAGGMLTDKELGFYSSFQRTTAFEVFSSVHKELAVKHK